MALVPASSTGLLESLVAEDGRTIITELRESDGYFNATKMCQAAGKRWANYFQTDRCQSSLAVVAAKTAIAVSTLVQSNHGGAYPGTWVHPTVATHLLHWLKRKGTKGQAGYVYVCTSPLLAAVKIGSWRGSVSNLRKRYRTPYGPQTEVHVQAVSNCLTSEVELHEQFRKHCLGGELFDKTYMSLYLNALSNS